MPRFFDVFAMPALVGRTFVDQEERFGGPAAAVISEPFWTRRFARNPAAIGQRLTIGGKGYTIVGVMPSAFTSGLGGTALRHRDLDRSLDPRADRAAPARDPRGAFSRRRRPDAARRRHSIRRAPISRASSSSSASSTRPPTRTGARWSWISRRRGSASIASRCSDLRRRRFVAADCRRQRRRTDARAAPSARDGARDSQRDRRVAPAGRHGDRARGRDPGDRWRDCRRVRCAMADPRDRDRIHDPAHLRGDGRSARAGVRGRDQRAGRRDFRPAARDPDDPARAGAGALVRRTRGLRRTSSPAGIARCRADRAQRGPCWRGRIARAQLRCAVAEFPPASTPTTRSPFTSARPGTRIATRSVSCRSVW